MKRIYTRSGDTGLTATHGGARIPKYHPRIEAVGELDELNTAIGMVRTMCEPSLPGFDRLRDIQLLLMTLMSRVATPADRRDSNPNPLPGSLVADAEALIDSVAATCSESDCFILPGGAPAAAFLHQARVAARRAERRLWALDAVDPVEPQVLAFINRLSDLFFVMARAALEAEGIGEERWREFTYRRKRKSDD